MTEKQEMAHGDTAYQYARVAKLISMKESERLVFKLDYENIVKQMKAEKNDVLEFHIDKQKLGYKVLRKKELECAILKLDLEIDELYFSHKKLREDLKSELGEMSNYEEEKKEKKKDDIIVIHDPKQKDDPFKKLEPDFITKKADIQVKSQGPSSGVIFHSVISYILIGFFVTGLILHFFFGG